MYDINLEQLKARGLNEVGLVSLISTLERGHSKGPTLLSTMISDTFWSIVER